MTDSAWLELEPHIRWYLYLGGFALVALWETLQPRRKLVCSTPIRWCGQLALVVSASALTLWIVPVGSIESAFLAHAEGRGLLQWSGLPWAAQAAIGIVVLDFVRFGQHWCYHRFPLLWRIHRVHHSDPDFDLTTGLRFHPLDPLINTVTYIPVVWLLGPPPVAVMMYELAHVVHAFFSHSNVRMPARLETWMRWAIVTPETHRIHHSDDIEESQRNFGEMFSFFDRILGTYRAQPAQGHEAMGIGLKGYQDARTFNFVRMLAWPFYDGAMGSPDRSERQAEAKTPVAAGSLLE